MPFPPPGGWGGAPASATTSASVAGSTPVVQATPIPAQPVETTPSSRRRRKLRIPIWIALPLFWLGIVHVFTPLLGDDGVMYVMSIVFAVAIGVSALRRYRSIELYRDNDGVIIWTRWRNKGHADEALPTVTMRSSGDR